MCFLFSESINTLFFKISFDLKCSSGTNYFGRGISSFKKTIFDIMDLNTNNF